MFNSAGNLWEPRHVDYIVDCFCVMHREDYNRTFYMVVLMGYSVAGIQIVVVVHSGRMRLSGQPRVIAGSRHDSGGPSGDTWGVGQFVSGAQREQSEVRLIRKRRVYVIVWSLLNVSYLFDVYVRNYIK